MSATGAGHPLAALRVLVQQARAHVADLGEHSAHPAVRRVVNAVERLAIDVAEAADHVPEVTSTRHDVVVVPDTPYDPDFWHGADDEGVGGYRPHYR